MTSGHDAPPAIPRAPHGSRLQRSASRRSASWSARQFASALALAGIEALAPPRCAGCGWFSKHLFCERCALRVRRVDRGASLCACCGERFDPLVAIAPGAICADCRGLEGKVATPIERARSLWMLRGPVRLAVHDFKYRRHTDLAASLGAHLGLFARQDVLFSGAALIIPVPLHPWREWARGFNQSGLLAEQVAREMGLPCAEVLRRVRHTPSQTMLSRSARDANVRAAFQVRDDVLAKYLQRAKESSVLLVDDVWTTGATLRECARALRKAGVGHVYALTLARRGAVPAVSPVEA